MANDHAKLRFISSDEMKKMEADRCLDRSKRVREILGDVVWDVTANRFPTELVGLILEFDDWSLSERLTFYESIYAISCETERAIGQLTRKCNVFQSDIGKSQNETVTNYFRLSLCKPGGQYFDHHGIRVECDGYHYHTYRLVSFSDSKMARIVPGITDSIFLRTEGDWQTNAAQTDLSFNILRNGATKSVGDWIHFLWTCNHYKPSSPPTFFMSDTEWKFALNNLFICDSILLLIHFVLFVKLLH